MSVGIAYRWAKKHDMDLMSTIIVVFVNFILINSNMIEGDGQQHILEEKVCFLQLLALS